MFETTVSIPEVHVPSTRVCTSMSAHPFASVVVSESVGIGTSAVIFPGLAKFVELFQSNPVPFSS